MNTKLSADESAWLLAHKLRQREPFFYARFGDGFLECLAGKRGGTCDGELYDPVLGVELLRCWRRILGAPGVYLGDWQSASFRGVTDPSQYAKQYADLVGTARPNWLHFEALLLMRESEELLDFYRAVREDGRRKLYMGPLGNAKAAEMLGADFLETPMRHLSRHVSWLTDELQVLDFDVLLYGAGMAGNIPVVRCWETFPERTYVSLGSALDPVGKGRSRKQQITVERARAMFRQLEGTPSLA